MLTNEIIRQLNPKQILLLTYLYNECINNLSYSKSNKDLEKATGIPESTIEKHLKLFTDLGFILRSSEREKDLFSGNWRTVSRSITLNPKVFDPKLIAAEKNTRINSLLDMLESPEFSLRSIERKMHTT